MKIYNRIARYQTTKGIYQDYVYLLCEQFGVNYFINCELNLHKISIKYQLRLRILSDMGPFAFTDTLDTIGSVSWSD